MSMLKADAMVMHSKRRHMGDIGMLYKSCLIMELMLTFKVDVMTMHFKQHFKQRQMRVIRRLYKSCLITELMLTLWARNASGLPCRLHQRRAMGTW